MYQCLYTFFSISPLHICQVGVVKLDCEGLDIAIVTTYLDMLQK